MESEQTLIAKWKQVQTEQQGRRSKALLEAQVGVDRLKAQQAALEARGEGEEAFFVLNDLQLAQEYLDKIKNEESTAEENLEEIEKLLRIVNHKLKMNRALVLCFPRCLSCLPLSVCCGGLAFSV